MSALISSFVQKGLTAGGYSIVVVHRGDVALDRMRDARPDLVLLDVMLPGIDGFEVLGGLRAMDPVSRSSPASGGTCRTRAQASWTCTSATFAGSSTVPGGPSLIETVRGMGYRLAKA